MKTKPVRATICFYWNGRPLHRTCLHPQMEGNCPYRVLEECQHGWWELWGIPQVEKINYPEARSRQGYKLPLEFKEASRPDKCDRCGDWFIVKDEFGDWACRCGRRFYDEKLMELIKSCKEEK